MLLPESKKYLYNVCAIISLITLISLISVYKSPPARRATGGSALPGHASCRSLFTITRAPDNDTMAAAHSLQHSGQNTHDNETSKSYTWRPPHSHTNLWHVHMSEAIRRVQDLLQKRSTPSGASSEDYRRLGKLLPTLLSFQGNINTGHDHNQREKIEKVNLRFYSRISATGGVLPHVPCAIAPFDDPATVTACLRERLDRKDSLWIAFYGDSKVRELFYELLLKTNGEYNFTIHFQNRTEAWDAVKERSMQVKMHEDMVATTQLEQRMRITYSFRSFSDLPVDFNTTKELLELRGWASGEQQPPQLLIVGYTSWMMQRMMWLYPYDVLSFLMQMHQQVAPLLEQISERTRVLLLAQSRFRPHATWILFNMRTAFSDAVADWSEMVLLYYLQQHRVQQLSSPTPRAFPAHPAPATWSQEEDGASDGPAPRPQLEVSRDYLEPKETGGGVWWWDTGVPLNMAEISECEELYRRGLVSHPLYNSPYFRCSDSQHAGRASLADQITMLLNLMCNSVDGADDGVCCH
nr:uncharacterized protein LOC123758074 [Procambarus clarkii]